MPQHAALITTLLLDRPMCLNCIATKTEMSVPTVRAYLEQIANAVCLRQQARERCQTCGTAGPTVSIRRPE